MTKQDKIDFKDPIVQNLFLLYQNKKFRSDIDNVSKKYRSEISKIRESQSIVKFIASEYKSEKLDSEIQKIVFNTPLIYGDSLTLTKAFVIFVIFGKNPLKVLRMFDVNENKLLITPPSIEIESNSEGTRLEILMSNYHSLSDLTRFLKSKWKMIEKDRSKWNSGNLKLQKIKALDLEHDWKIYEEHMENSHYEVVEKLKLNDISTSSMVVSRINKRIKLLYP